MQLLTPHNTCCSNSTLSTASAAEQLAGRRKQLNAHAQGIRTLKVPKQGSRPGAAEERALLLDGASLCCSLAWPVECGSCSGCVCVWVCSGVACSWLACLCLKTGPCCKPRWWPKGMYDGWACLSSFCQLGTWTTCRLQVCHQNAWLS